MINQAASLSNDFALDVKSVGDLKLRAKTDPDAALKAAAQQFEAVFMQMMMKSMRDSVSQDGMFDSEETRQYTAMLDQQLAQKLSGHGLGLADVMIRQLRPGAAAHGVPHAQRATTVTPANPFTISASASDAAAVPPAVAGTSVSGATGSGSAASGPGAFVNRLWPHAAEASRSTGIAPNLMIGHAALESGWGKAEIRAADGTPSHNLFGIKAGRDWTGPVVQATTTEYVNGVPQKSVEKFRAYSSYAEAFKDYARVLRGNPRYASVLDNGNNPAAFAASLQQAGYATDPMYADKLTRILHGATLRQSLMG